MELALLTAFIIKHFVIDYCLQTSFMIQHKGTYGAWGGVWHSLQHGIGSGIIYLTFGILPAILALIVDYIAHYHIDYVKSNLWKLYNFEKTDRGFWIIHGIDQLLHYLTYVAIYVLISQYWLI